MDSDSNLLLTQIDLGQNTNIPLNRKVYESFRRIILEGRLGSDQRLPSTRAIARHFGISRTTVLIAFENLLAEGYIQGRLGSGTFVSDSIPEKFLTLPTDAKPGSNSYDSTPLSKRGKVLADSIYSVQRNLKNLKPFRPGIPSLRDFPIETWARLAGRQLRTLPFERFGYGDPAGYGPLRQVIAHYLQQTRAVRCESDQIVIVNGSQQGLNLVVRVLLDPGDAVWFEDPGYTGAREAFTGSGLTLIPAPLDDQGITVPTTGSASSKLIYITPSHQYPMGLTLSLARRLLLLEHAAKTGSWILEDDYDSEYRFSGRPLSSLQGLDSASRVIYMGTFSKVLFPGIRLGYLVVPGQLVDAFISARAKMDRNSPILEQATLHQFMDQRLFSRHVRKMRMLYMERQEYLLETARAHLAGLLHLKPGETGLHLVGWLQSGITEEAVKAASQQIDLIVPTLKSFTIKHWQNPGVVLGYAAFTKAEINSGITRLADRLESSLK